MKLDEKAIEKLVEEVLQERKIKIKYPNGEIYQDTELYNAVYGQPTVPKDGFSAIGIRDLAKIDRDASGLSDDDFDMAIDRLNGGTKVVGPFDTTKKGTNSKKQKQRAIAAKADWDKGSAGNIFKGEPKDQPSVKSLSQTQKDRGDDIDLGTGEDRFSSIPSVELDYQDIAGDFVQKELKPNRTLDATTLAVFKKEIEEHGTLTEMFSHYQSLSKKISKATQPGATDAEKKEIAGMSTDELFNSASVMATLNYLINTFQGASAGTIFETFLALQTGGIVFGGGGAASDILAGKKGTVMMSAKAYDKASPSGSQDRKNIHLEAKEVGDTIWYIGLAKINASKGEKEKNFNVAKIFITGIQRVAPDLDENGKKFDLDTDTKLWPKQLQKNFVAVDADGNRYPKKLETVSTGKKKENQYKIPFKGAGEEDFKIEFATDLNAKMGSRNFQNMFQAAVQAGNNDVQKALQQVYSSLDEIKQQTQRYVAVSKKPTSPNQSVTIATAAGQKYKSLLANLQSSYGGIAGERGEDTAKQDTIKSKFVSESKLQSLDKLILEVLKENT